MNTLKKFEIILLKISKPGNPSQRLEMGVYSFVSKILSNFSCLLLAVIPYHGKLPLIKYTSM